MTIDAGNFAACLERIAEKGKLSAAQALELLEQVAERGERMRETGIADPFVSAAGALAREIKEGAARAKTDALRNAQIRTKIMSQVKAAGGHSKRSYPRKNSRVSTA